MGQKIPQEDLLKELYSNFHINSYNRDHQQLVKKIQELPKKVMITASYDASKRQ